MSNKDLLDNIKRLREITGVGFKDCKIALDETKGNIEICPLYSRVMCMLNPFPLISTS